MIAITNPDGAVIMPSLIEPPEYDEYMDKPKRITAKIEKLSGIDPRGTAKATFRGKIVLLGHVRQLDQSKPEYDTLILDSAEALLENRIGQFYRFPAGTSLNTMLQMLIDMANGLVPRGSWTLHSGSVYKIVGAGTSSRFGALDQLYQGTTLLTKATAIPTSAGRWYQSSTDLYIWTTDSKSPDYHLIIAPNFKDTLLRLGSISLGSTSFDVCYEIGASKLSSPIKNLILAAGLEYQIRYEKDGYAYLDALPAIGKGSSSEPVATYIDGENAEITTDIMDGYGNIQALLGQGAGAGITQQCSAVLDLATTGTWREAIYSAGGLFGAMLRQATAKVFSDYADPTIYNIRTIDQDWSQEVGNWVGIRRQGHQPVYKRIKHVQMKGGEMVLEVGQRLQTIQELLKAGEEVQSILSSFYGAHTKNAWSWSIDSQNIDSATPLTIEFDLRSSEENGEIDPNFPYQVLLNVKLDWFKSSVKSATVGGASHGAVGMHGGYGGVETSSEEMTAHNVPELTSEATGDEQTISVVDDITDYEAIIITADLVELEDSRGDSYYFWENFEDRYGLGHRHDMNVLYIHVPSGAHKHPLPAHYTSAGEDQSHTEYLKTAKTRSGSPQHADQILTADNNKIDYMVNWLPTGSAALLVLSVKCNGNHVPGSPFTGMGGLYIGDSLYNIDLSGLVTVGANNTLTFELSEYLGSNPVKCSISGNVAVSAIISAF